MAAIFAFKCNSCGDIHEGSPSFGFRAPDHYVGLSDVQQAASKLSDDLCVIERDGVTDRFVRAVLEVPIHGVSDPFLWGVWVSLSEKSFKRYVDTFDDPVAGEGFFGWVCNDISQYPYHRSRAADVVVQGGHGRPKVVLHQGDAEDDPLVLDQAQGISIARAQELAESAMHES
ncbi:MAG TPA: DUF2199 domain-containing protein [Burkholderiaceae bacterium]|jgi:hypothetical protein